MKLHKNLAFWFLARMRFLLPTRGRLPLYDAPVSLVLAWPCCFLSCFPYMWSLILMLSSYLTGWLGSWKRECFSTTTQHVSFGQPERRGELDRQSLPPPSEETQDPQEEMNCDKWMDWEEAFGPLLVSVHLRCSTGMVERLLVERQMKRGSLDWVFFSLNSI